MTFGMKGQADVMAKGVRLKGRRDFFPLIAGGEETEVSLPLLGKHFVSNALSAVAVAALFGIDANKAKEALEHYRPFPMRMEVCHLEAGKTLIDDSYNANPVSMELALETLAEVKGRGRAIAVLGDMLELGEFLKAPIVGWDRRSKNVRSTSSSPWERRPPSWWHQRFVMDWNRQRARVAKSHSEAISHTQQVAARRRLDFGQRFEGDGHGKDR